MPPGPLWFAAAAVEPSDEMLWQTVQLPRSTSGTAEDRHTGLSQMLVDLHAPGVSVRPIELMTGDAEFSEVTFDDVYLPPDALVGTDGNGWAQVNAELAFERGTVDLLAKSSHVREFIEPEISQLLFTGNTQRQGAGQVDARSRTESLGVCQAEFRPAQNPFP